MRGETGIDDTTIFLPSSREASALGNVVVGHPLKFKFTGSALLPPKRFFFESSTKVSPISPSSSSSPLPTVILNQRVREEGGRETKFSLNADSWNRGEQKFRCNLPTRSKSI